MQSLDTLHVVVALAGAFVGQILKARGVSLPLLSIFVSSASNALQPMQPAAPKPVATLDQIRAAIAERPPVRVPPVAPAVEAEAKPDGSLVIVVSPLPSPIGK